MKREQLLSRLDSRWNEFKTTYTGLTEEQMLEPGVTELWSVKDVVAHVSTWEEEALKYLPLILKGKRPPLYAVQYGGLDAFNAIKTVEKRDLTLTEVYQQFETIHQKLVEYIETVPEEEFTTETKFRHRLRLDTYSHYPLHTKMVREWREQKKI